MPSQIPTQTEHPAKQLKQAGWDIVLAGLANKAGGLAWTASGSNGENRIEAIGSTPAEAWQAVLGQAQAFGMLGLKPDDPSEG